MMANTSRLECRTGYLLLLPVAIGLLILPFGSSQYCNTNFGEPLIKISSTPPSNKLPIGASINLTCSAWQTEQLAKTSPRTRPQRIEWFDPQDRRLGECHAESPAAASMKCTAIVGALTEEKFGNYTCKASNGFNYCSNKRFSIILQASENEEETENETVPTPEPKEIEEIKIVASSSGFKKVNIKLTEGKKPPVSSKEEDTCIARIKKRKILLKCSKLRLAIKISKKDLEHKEEKKSFDK